jgi:hypothetical protein
MKITRTPFDRPKAGRRLLPLILLLAAMPLFSLDWPVQKRILTGTLGEDRSDHFHNGIDIGGGEQEVHPVIAGDLVFRYDENDDYTTLPRGVGSFVVLHHSQDILSFYCHLASGSLGPLRTAYSPSDRVGIIGDTGHAEGKHLHFTVYDEETGSYINPLSFLPPLPDSQPPVIRRVVLSVGDQIQPLENGVRVRPGQGEILAEAYDLREDVKFQWTLAPYSLSLGLDGKEIAKILFDSLQVSEGRMVLGASRLARENLYRADGLVRCGAVELRTGESRLRLAVRDFAGNETVREIAFTVRE